MVDEDGPSSRVRFSVMSAHYDESATAKWQYGLERESARLDLNTLLQWEMQRPGTGRRSLMGLPGDDGTQRGCHSRLDGCRYNSASQSGPNTTTTGR